MERFKFGFEVCGLGSGVETMARLQQTQQLFGIFFFFMYYSRTQS